MYRIARQALTLMLVAAAISDASAGATYRWVDAQGVVHYSDTPQPGATQVALPSAQTYHSAPVAPVTAASAPAPGNAAADASYTSCAIAQPAAAETLFAPESVHISVAMNPPLHPGDQLSLTMDGAALPPVVEGGQEFQVNDIARGSHTLAAVVRSPAGKVLCSASAVTFYVQRASIANPLSPVHPH